MIRVSIVMEWSNTEFGSTDKAFSCLRELRTQWQMRNSNIPSPDLVSPDAQFLSRLEDSLELIIVSGTPFSPTVLKELHEVSTGIFTLSAYTLDGAEYYPLKNHGANASKGDIIIFLDSDVLPDEGWLVSMLRCFSNLSIQVCQGQTYVKPDGLFAKAFALGWIYDIRDPRNHIKPARKLFANNIAFRRDVFMPEGFPASELTTRGSGSEMAKRLDTRNIVIWENLSASVAHPPPSGWRHLAVRALARSRDHYMRKNKTINAAALQRTLSLVICRYRVAIRRILSFWGQVGAHVWEVPIMIVIISMYYFFFAAGSVICYVNPAWMVKHFRI